MCRVFQRGAEQAQNGDDMALIAFEKAEEKRIRMHGFESETGKNELGKVAQIDRDDTARLAVNGGGQNVAIIGIRQRKGANAMLIAFDDGIVDTRVHKTTRALDARLRNVGTVAGSAATHSS